MIFCRHESSINISLFSFRSFKECQHSMQHHCHVACQFSSTLYRESCRCSMSTAVHTTWLSWKPYGNSRRGRRTGKDWDMSSNKPDTGSVFGWRQWVLSHCKASVIWARGWFGWAPNKLRKLPPVRRESEINWWNNLSESFSFSVIPEESHLKHFAECFLRSLGEVEVSKFRVNN